MDESQSHHQTRETLETLAGIYLTRPSDAPSALHPQPFKLDPTLPTPHSTEADFAAPSEHVEHRNQRGQEFHGEQTLCASPAPTGAAGLELMLLGHLPAFCSPWLTQYAHELAQERGVVGVIEADAEDMAVDLVGRDAASADTRSAEYGSAYAHHTIREQLMDAPSTSGGSEADTTARVPLLRRLRQLAPNVSSWLIHCTDPLAPPARRLARTAGTWTLLTTADDVAVVGAYRLLKALTDASEGEAPRVSNVRLLLVGCEEQQAHQAAERLRRGVASFLQTSVEVIGRRQRMAPASRRHVGTFKGGEGAWCELERFVHEIPGREAAPETRSAADGSSQTPRATDNSSAPTPANPSSADAAPATRAASAAPDSKPETPDGQLTSPPLLAEYLESTTPLCMRCPREPDVQAGVDEEGRLHLMLYDAAESAEKSLSQLLIARAWGIEHQQLLTASEPRLRFAPDRPPAMHLFTQRPRPALRLEAGGMGEPYRLRLHLLKPVAIASQTQWVHAELR